jgi:nucleoside-diphosphate-sugar epimerase
LYSTPSVLHSQKERIGFGDHRGSNRPLIITSGTGMDSRGPGELAVEQVFDRDNPNPRRLCEVAGVDAAQRGVSVPVVRLPQVHDTKRHGLISPVILIARQKGMSAYVGNGASRWPAAHVTDVARLYRLALEKHESGARWHAVAEEGVPLRKIAEAIGAGFRVPVRSLSPDQAAEHFGWLGPFAGMDMPASSASTRERLDWQPTGPSHLDDLQNMDFGAPQT